MLDAGVIEKDTYAQVEGENQATTVGALLDKSASTAEPLLKASARELSTQSPFAPAEIIDPFGLTIDTPVPVTNIPAGSEYLRLLATPDHKRLQTRRLGSFSSSRFEHPVDKWELRDSAGRFIYHLFVYAYAASDAKRAPQGLIHFDPMGDFRATPEGKKAVEDLMATLKAEPWGQDLLAAAANTRKLQQQLHQEVLTGKPANLGRSGCLGVVIILVLAILLFLRWGI